MGKFELIAGDDMMWTVRDTETNVCLSFREGLFNDTQHIETPDTITEEQALHLPTTLREMGDWMAKKHPEVAMCHSAERCTAIWMLANEKYWITLAAATSSLMVDFGEDNAAEFLCAEVDDYLEGENVADLNEAEMLNLRGSLSMLSGREAMEVVNMVYVYWHYLADCKDIATRARDLLWWPAWCPEELMYNDNDDEEGE